MYKGMKGKIIILNWVLSFMGLSIDTEASPIWACLVALAWFAGSSLLLIYANKRGMVKGIINDEL